jgi:hypothetical protein
MGMRSWLRALLGYGGALLIGLVIGSWLTTRATISEVAKAVERAGALEGAARMAISLRLYADDWEEQFPPVRGFSAAIEPYRGVPDHYSLRFVYTPPKESVKARSALKKLPVGFVQFQGKKAIAYADGSARLED